VQRDADVAVLAGVAGGGARAGLGYIFAEGEGDEGCGFANVGGHTAGWAAGSSPSDLCEGC
jgi:hypothetical protein